MNNFRNKLQKALVINDYKTGTLRIGLSLAFHWFRVKTKWVALTNPQRENDCPPRCLVASQCPIYDQRRSHRSPENISISLSVFDGKKTTILDEDMTYLQRKRLRESNKVLIFFPSF